MKIHVWVPDYALAIGGIQTFSRFMVRGLRDLFPHAWIAVFSKNDTSHPDPSSDPSNSFAPLGRWTPKLRTMAFAAKLFQQAAKQRPDWIITTHVNFAPVAHALQRLLRIPYLAVGHGVEVWDIPSVRLRNSLRAANRLLAVSAYTRARMAAALRISPEKISLLPDTFDQEKFQIGPKPQFLLTRYKLERDQPVIFTLARLEVAEQYKGYDQVLRALPKVRAAISNIRYILGGSGDDRLRIESLIRQLNLTDAVTLAGHIADDELCAHYNLCDLFVMPSKGEGFGIVFLEALSCGKPVIAGNQDASPEAVLTGKVGLLVNPDDPGEIAGAIVRLLTHLDPASILHQPAKLRNEVTQAYGYSRFVKRLGEIIGREAEMLRP